MIFLNKSLFYNSRIFQNFINNVFLKNLYIYKNILYFYNFNSNYQLLISFKFKYSWVDNRNDFNKFYFNFSEKNKFVEFFTIDDAYLYFEKYFYINNCIKFKNRFGFFKKTNSVRSFYLNKFNFFKNDHNGNEINSDLSDNLNLDFKSFDFLEKKLFIYKSNRKILNFFFKKNKKIGHYINKFIKKLSKTNLYNYLNFFEYSIVNILLNSNFFFNKNDIHFFLKKKYVYINNKIITNCNYTLNKNDLLTLSFNKYFYFLYRNYINNFNSNVNKYNNFFKKFSSNVENDFQFINKLYLIRNDVPNYLEVDYLSLSLILLNKYNANYNCCDLKSITVFFKRLNNWKYII